MTPEEKKADARLKRVFGITLDEYNEMLAAQDGHCKICGAPPRTKRLAVDHDHFFDRIKIQIIKNKTDNITIFTAFCSYINFTFTSSDRKKAKQAVKIRLRRHSIRGLLCAICNRTLQRFYDKPDRFEAAAKYLREFQSKKEQYEKNSSLNLSNSGAVDSDSGDSKKESH